MKRSKFETFYEIVSVQSTLYPGFDIIAKLLTSTLACQLDHQIATEVVVVVKDNEIDRSGSNVVANLSKVQPMLQLGLQHNHPSP